MRMLLVNPFESTITEVDIEPKLEAYYEILGTDVVEMPTFGPLRLICDENGRLKLNQRCTLFLTGNHYIVIAGKSLICWDLFGEEGELSKNITPDVFKEVIWFLSEKYDYRPSSPTVFFGRPN